MTIWRYASRFCTTPTAHQLTLGEGDTPLVAVPRLGAELGLPHLLLKLETGNPTGSYKDRFAAVAIADMLAQGQTHCLATSSGNTGAALAAYCAAAGLTCEIAAVEPAPPQKLQQMMLYGAKVYRVRGFGLDAAATAATFAQLHARAQHPGVQLQISAYTHSPAGMAGVQTISYEIAQQAAAPVEHVFVPAGGGGLTLAIARGFADLVTTGDLPRSPAIHCVQPEGNDTIATPLRQHNAARAVTCTSRISGLQVPTVIDGDMVIAACIPTGGTGHAVTDEAVWQMQQRLARTAGVFCEPAGAVALAGAVQALQAGEISADQRVVCIVTGVGFKDAPSIERMLAGIDCPLCEPDALA